MAKDNSNSFNNNSSLLSEPGSNKSFVKKVGSRVSEFLPSSLSKWFGNVDKNKATVRQREDDDDDECCEIQPPSKRAKMPSPISLHNIHINSVSSPTYIANDTNRIQSTTTGDKQNNFRDTTFSEPTPGPSGMKLRKLFSQNVPVQYSSSENLLNGDKDSDSGESTSGYSSMPRISHKKLGSSEDVNKADASMPNVNPNNLFNTSAFGSHSRSLFTERSLSPQINSSLSSRRPSFNASTFGSPNFIDRTLSTKRIINSPFYNGRTTYGGASAYGFQQDRSSKNMRSSARNLVQVKPVNQSVVSDNASLSKTARRILDTLEQYGTPVSDAKKIPNPSFKKSRHESLLSKYTGANPYLMREHKASNRELQLPTVPDLLKMKLKERLQDSTVAVRQIATTSKSALNSDEYKIRTAEEETPKHTNKMKNKVTSTRQKPENEATEQVKLPNVTLPITTLPKFDFSLPLPPSCSKPLVTVACDSFKTSENISKVPEETIRKDSSPVLHDAKSSSDTVEYTFSNPLVLAENLVQIIAINDFKFSEPLIKEKGKTTTEVTSTSSKGSSPMVNFKSSDISNKFKSSDILSNFKSSDSSNIRLKRKSHSNTESIQPAAELLPGSVEDILSKKTTTDSPSLFDKFKPAAGTWECSDCLIRNLPEKLKCVACEAPKAKKETLNKKETPLQPKAGFGEAFKMTTDKWECSACMVRNVSTDTKCVACTTPKTNSSKPNGPVTSLPAPTNAFGDKFKPPSSTWECPICLIRNNNETEKCMACETVNPTQVKNTVAVGFGNSFKMKTSEWECKMCMIRNPSEENMCMACETPKPGAVLTKINKPKETQPAVPTFNFGIFPGAATNTQGVTIEPTKTTKDEETDKSVTISSVFGNATATTAPTATVPTFTFGIPSKNSTETTVTKSNELKVEPLSKPAEKLPEKPLPTPTGYLFSNSSVNSVKSTHTGSTDKLQMGSSMPLSKPEEKSTQPVIPPVTFTFGNSLSQPDNTKPEPSVSSSQKLTENLTQKPVSSVAGFTFGNVAPALKRSANDSDLQAAGIGAKKEAPSPAESIIFSPPKHLIPSKADSNILNKPTLPLNGNSTKSDKIVFGSLTSVPPTQTTPNNSFTFSPSQTQSALPTTSTNTNLFNFGAKTTSVPVFGNTATTTEAPVFKFGVNTAKPPSGQSGFNINTNVQPIPSNMFGNNSNSTSIFGTPNKPIFETASKPVFEAPNKPIFEAPSKSVFETPNKSVFEVPNKSVFEASSVASAPTPAFGSSVTSTGFGASTAASEIKPFPFGARANENPPPSKAPGFSFGQSSKPAEPAKAPAFTFGSSTSTAATGGFSFNTNTNTAPNPSFNFNAPKADNPSPFQSAAPAPSIFGTPAQVHTQPQPPAQPVQNGGFNFGGAPTNSNVKTGFNFGVAPTPQFNPAPLVPTGVFNFGPANPNPAPPAGGFTFGPGTAPPPAFNANVKPTFNFTGGTTPTFSAQPSGENSMVAQRKKIRAVRRTQR